MAKILGAQIPSELKNLAINGAMDFFQRIEGNSINISATVTSSAYYADMIKYTAGGTTAKTYVVQRSGTVPTQTQSGFNSTYSTAFTMTTGISMAATDYIVPFQYNMEGLDYERIHNKPAITFGFWIYATVPGTYSFAMGNASGARSYVTTFTVAAATTWQFVSITAPTDNSGSWSFDNSLGLAVYIAGVSGTTNATGTTNSWQTTASASFTATGATNWAATNNAVVQIAQFSIVEGPLGFSATGFMRQGKSIGQELALCQRYYEKSYAQGNAPGSSATDGYLVFVQPTASLVRVKYPLKVQKRASPTTTIWTVLGTISSGQISHDVAGNQSVGSVQSDMGSHGWEIASNSSADPRSYWHFTSDAGL